MNAISRRAFFTGAAALAVSLASCSTRTPAESVAMACGEEGGIYIEFGGLIGRAMLREKNIAVAALATNGSADNLRLLAAREVELGIALADSATHRGDGLVALGSVYQNYLQCIVRASDRIATLADLAGLRVSTGAPGSGSSFTTRRLLSALEMDRGVAALQLSEHGLEGALTALANGEIDAMFWSSGIPTPKIAELHESTPLRLLDLTAALAALESGHPGQYLPARVPAGVYDATSPVTTVGVPNYLLARPDLPDGIARALVEVLVHEAPSLIPEGTVGLQFLTSATLIDTGAIPLHPAARRRYRELYG